MGAIYEEKARFGKLFEELEVGATYKHYPGRTITEADNIWFSLLTMNQHPLHIDRNYGNKTQHGQCLVVGTLVFSIAVGLSVRDISGKCIANLEYEQVEHLAPTFVGDTIYAETTVLEKRESTSKPDRGIVLVETLAKNQHGTPVLRFRRKVLVPNQRFQESKGID